MAPKVKTDEEKKIERKIILNSAMNLVKEKGYNALSMREVAKSCNFTATKIYYYFINKEHIVFNLSELCFDEIREYLINDLKNYDDCEQRFRQLLLNVYNFCTDRPYYYDLMFGIDIPKCSDFYDVEIISDSASGSMAAAQEFNRYFHSVVADYAKHSGKEFDENHSLSIFARLIGVIHLQNSNIFREINVNGKNIIDITIYDILCFN